MASTTSSRTHEQVQQADCWNDWNSPTLIHHHSASFSTPMRAMEGNQTTCPVVNIFMGHNCNTFCRSACLLTAGGQEQHQFYRSEPHQQGAGPPVMMQQETCDKSSVSPTPTASHNNSLSSGMSPLGSGNHTGDQSSVTKEERTSRQRGQSSPSPSKSGFFLKDGNKKKRNKSNQFLIFFRLGTRNKETASR